MENTESALKEEENSKALREEELERYRRNVEWLAQWEKHQEEVSQARLLQLAGGDLSDEGYMESYLARYEALHGEGR